MDALTNLKVDQGLVDGYSVAVKVPYINILIEYHCCKISVLIKANETLFCLLCNRT